ncbi:lipopolysaccharide biosynthesis protein [Rubritalea spongiae]|uniref:Lipopolysaccharide biosynthesis protein n=1 Tax=Rubritalea spongiae TaxID=430797 RepID=A0ABW5E4M4_9BACT
MSVKKNIAKNGIATVLQKLVLAGQHLFLVPFFLSAWGAEYYGEWLTLTAIPAAIALTDLGFGTAFGNAFVLKYAAGEKQQAADLLKTAVCLIALCCVVVLMGTSAVVGIVHAIGGFEKIALPEDVAITALMLLILSRLLGFFLSLGEAQFRAIRKAHQYINFFTVFSVIRIVVGCVVLLSGGRAIEYAVADLGVSVVFLVTVWVIGQRTVVDLGRGKLIKQWSVIRPLATKGFAYMLTPLQQGISLQGASLVVRVVLGAEAVALFNSMRTLVNAAHQVLSTINASLFPELQIAIAEKRQERVSMLYGVGMLSAGLLGSIAAGGFVLLGPFVFALWTGGVFQPSFSLWLLFGVVLLVRSLWWTAGMSFRAANCPGWFNILSLVFTCIGVAVAYALSMQFGLNGVLCGLVLMECLIAVYTIPSSMKLLDLSAKDLSECRDVISFVLKKLKRS